MSQKVKGSNPGPSKRFFPAKYPLNSNCMMYCGICTLYNVLNDKALKFESDCHFVMFKCGKHSTSFHFGARILFVAFVIPFFQPQCFKTPFDLFSIVVINKRNFKVS